MANQDELRRWILLCETQRTADFYVHVSPLKNLRTILSKGLLPNVEGGNYSGYETSLSGTYVTREPSLIRDHIHARSMENGFVLVLVQVANTEGVIDEDALHPWLLQCTAEVLGTDNAVIVDTYEPDDEIWNSVAACFATKLGQPDDMVLRQHPGLVSEFVETVIRSELYGEDGPDGDWWEEAKEQLIKAFPQLVHPVYGNRYSLRLPSVGYAGPTRIVAVISVSKGQEKIVKGTIPPDANRLIDACMDIAR